VKEELLLLRDDLRAAERRKGVCLFLTTIMRMPRGELSHAAACEPKEACRKAKAYMFAFRDNYICAERWRSGCLFLATMWHVLRNECLIVAACGLLEASRTAKSWVSALKNKPAGAEKLWKACSQPERKFRFFIFEDSII
jgi:hypothetical protein